MTEARKRKFRRWASKGVPASAPLAEKRAFGAFVTNRRKKIAKRLGSLTAGKAKPYSTKRTQGKWIEIDVDRPLTDIESEAFRRDVVALCWEFHKRHKGKAGFIRLKILAAPNPYSKALTDDEDEGEQVEHWFGSYAFNTQVLAKSVFDELCDRLTAEVLPYDNGEGRIIAIHTFTVRTKRK